MSEAAGLSAPIVFPAGDGVSGALTSVLLVPDGENLPLAHWIAPVRGAPALTPTQLASCRARSTGTAMLVEHARGSYRRPGLRGHRLDLGGVDQVAGHDWSTAFVLTSIVVGPTHLVIEAADARAGLTLSTEVEALPGGALRARHTVTNVADGPYLVEALEVSLPLAESAGEILDFTGRHERERTPQRHPIDDGLWLRENRRGRTALESPTMIIAGTPGFGFDHGEVLGAHVAFSGNSTLFVERDPSSAASIGGGELLLPGELVLGRGESYSSPWLVVAAATDGLDGIAAALHRWQRTLPLHPQTQPVVLNVWEAVYFDHDLSRLTALADRAAAVGVERFVLDDGWFLGRRDDGSGLGDWWVDETVWPQGLHPLADHVRALGMEFGLWFEPEMVNPDSDLYRRHPDWILGAGGRVPPLTRNQLVLDLTNKDVRLFLLERVDAVLTEYPIDYVKWDHNRDLLEAGSSVTGQPVAHEQVLAHYALLDDLRACHPQVAWESCASGGGRIDLGIIERVERVWTSDMTDALARQPIQRWTQQLVAPEYLGAHVSAPTSHQTGRTLPMDFRAATALFGAFGFEWDLTQAGDAELARIAEWTARFKRHRALLHTGRVLRVESGDPAVWLHGVVADDGREALLAHVQFDESASNRGVVFRVPGLHDGVEYTLRWAAPLDMHPMSQSPSLHPDGPTSGVPVDGAVLREQGFWLPRRRPETIVLMHVEAAGVVPGAAGTS